MGKDIYHRPLCKINKGSIVTKQGGDWSSKSIVQMWLTLSKKKLLNMSLSSGSINLIFETHSYLLHLTFPFTSITNRFNGKIGQLTGRFRR